ncbi:MAG: putative ATP synthase subunit C [Erysipelotrichaceae bacterium]|nr:MAG: putative ATP synthase subunit [Erysipelotrichaceae bacterium]TXT19733.1 MAG: putative ATP synthase subunit C [Erysipelotrichaceae bacterium]
MSATQALAAKAKAMYGAHLTKSDYDELLRKRTVQEIAGYLKNETHYDKILEGINESSIHRGYLEVLIRQRLFLDFMQLIRYGETRNHKFYQYGILQIEIKQILMTIRFLKETEKGGQISQLPLFANKMTSFDLQKLVNVNSYEELLLILKDTMYYSILLPYKPKAGQELDYTSCEIALNSMYHDKVLGYIEKEFTGTTKTQILDVFNTQIELDNITKIYRLKKYYRSTPEDIIKVLHPVYVKIPKHTLHQWIQTKSAEEFVDALSTTAYKSSINKNDFVYIEYHMDSIMYNINKHFIRFATDPNVVMIAYMNLLEIETRNIIDIIEGVRYKVETDKIAKLLIY